MPKRKEPEASSPHKHKNMEHSGARAPRAPPSGVILALEAPNISAIRSLRGRAAGRSGRGGRSGGDTISGSSGRSGGDSMPGRRGKSSRGGRSGCESICSRGGKSERGRRQGDQETTYHPSLRLPTTQQRKLLLKEKATEEIGIDLATMSMRRESSSTSMNNRVALTAEKNIAGKGLPPSNPTAMICQSEAEEIIEAFASAPAPEPGASRQADPSIESGGSGKADKAKLSLKPLEPVD